MMGVCFDCLMEIDGAPNRQACLVPVAEGMRINRQHGARKAEKFVDPAAGIPLPQSGERDSEGKQTRAAFCPYGPAPLPLTPALSPFRRGEVYLK